MDGNRGGKSAEQDNEAPARGSRQARDGSVACIAGIASPVTVTQRIIVSEMRGLRLGRQGPVPA